MHTKTMEGLIGARTNMNMTKVPMRVFKEARHKGDTAAMERAMGYVNDFENKAYEYKDKAEEGMKEEAKEAKEKEKLEQEQAIEKRREERKELEAQTDNVEKTEDTKTNYNTKENTNVPGQIADTVEISQKGQELLNQSSNDVPSNSVGTQPEQPVFYSSAGNSIGGIGQSNASTVNVSV